METLSRELTNVQSTWPMFDTADIRNDIGTILYAMNVLSTSYPVLGMSSLLHVLRFGESVVLISILQDILRRDCKR